MTDFSVVRIGTDTSGRPILCTRYMADWWEQVVAELGWRPVIVQGAFMTQVGGGAEASAGVHDQAGTFDLRTRDLTQAQSDQLVRTLRRFGAAAWRRDWTHGGMAPHLHLVLGTDRPLSSGAYIQWRDYTRGYDGLASRGKDYEWRPDPLVLTPPEEDIVKPEDIEAIADRVVEKLLATEIGAKDKLRVEQILNRVKTRLGRQ